jgi:hypothetical protein
LNPIAEECEIPPDTYVGNWNLDGQHPGPEVWKNPTKELRQMGFNVDPDTAPMPELLKDVERQVR